MNTFLKHSRLTLQQGRRQISFPRSKPSLFTPQGDRCRVRWFSAVSPLKMDDMRIYPAVKSLEPQSIPLSLCDAYAPKCWVTQCHFWPADKPNSFEEASRVLRESISRTLAEIPELAGNVERVSKEDLRQLRIDVAPNASIQFTQEDLSTAEDVPDYSTFRSKGFPVQDLSHRLSPPITLSPVVEGSPIFTAKLTKLNGGLVLAFGLNHVMTDMATVTEIERIWSLHTADVGSGRSMGKHRIDTDVAASKARLTEPRSDAGEFNDPHWQIFPSNSCQLNLPPPAATAEDAEIQWQKTKNAHHALHADAATTKWAVWYFSAEKLAALKQDASDGADPSRWISTMNALVGLLWSRIAAIQQKSKGGEGAPEKSELLFTINVRQRLEPALHPQFLGNVVDLVSAECSLPALESEDAVKGVMAGAQALREAVSGWTPGRFDAWLAKAAALPNEEAICPHPIMLLATQNMIFNDYSRSNAHLLDWGPGLGRIERTRFTQPAASMTGCATGVVVYPRLSDGGLEVAVACTDSVRAALQSDDLLQKYAKFNYHYT